MMKISRRVLCLSLILSVLIMPFFPTSVKAETLRDYENLLKKYEREQAKIN